jgi:hypothetical protein
MVFVALGATLAACARSAAPSRDALVRWESSYVPAAQCRPSIRRATADTSAERMGTLVVRLTGFASPALVDHSTIVVTPLAPHDSLVQPVVRRADSGPPGAAPRMTASS